MKNQTKVYFFLYLLQLYYSQYLLANEEKYSLLSELIEVARKGEDEISNFSLEKINFSIGRYDINETKRVENLDILLTPLGLAILKNFPLRVIEEIIDAGATSQFSLHYEYRSKSFFMTSPAMVYAIKADNFKIAALLIKKFGSQILQQSFIPGPSRGEIKPPFPSHRMNLIQYAQNLDRFEWVEYLERKNTCHMM